MALTLAELNLKTEYRSDTDDLVRDFYLPCLSRSTLYRRAVGYFTSRSLSIAAQGITALINSDGRMLLVASPLFESEDLKAIERGYLAREDAITRAILREIEAAPNAIVRDRLGYLAWLVAESRLELRIAVRNDYKGFYHEKLGIFSDDLGNAVAFTGSPNETGGGLIDNFEATDVFCSWKDPDGRVSNKIANFERLWIDKTEQLCVTPFPEAARKQLLRYRPNIRPQGEVRPWVGRKEPSQDFPLALWDHQIDAIRAWEGNQRSGIVSMATGSGKTLTALIAAQRCPRPQMIVIAVPTSALVKQWEREVLEKTSFPQPVLAYESSEHWQDLLFNKLRAARPALLESPVVVVGTMSSISGPKFRSVLADGGLSGNSLLVVDEVHNVGAPTYQNALSSYFNWRLGLSATPSRHFDEEGSQAIQDYFGSTVFCYDMRQAMTDGLLCPYHYFVFPANLDDTEFEEYVELTKRIIQLRGEDSEEVTVRTDNALDRDSALVKQLLFRRSSILKKCRSKIDALDRALQAHGISRGLIYCADMDQLSEAARLLERREIVYLSYTAETRREARASALEAIGAGHVRAVVAIKCLDEGVDVPSVDEAVIIASSSNKREFIQRRGRILRRAPGKSVATLIDIVALPPSMAGDRFRWMLYGEMARVKEMAELALNKYESLMNVKKCVAPYGVMLTDLMSGEGDG
jgi:superfamily II DNA or RNA helicase